jgi:hypothetical protein
MNYTEKKLVTQSLIYKLSISRKILPQLVSSFFFLSLTAGFLVYNEAVARNLFPPVFGGFYGIASLGAIVLLGIPSLNRFVVALRYKFIFPKAFIMLIAWLMLSIFFGFLVGIREYKLQAAMQLLDTLFLWLASFSIGFFLKPTKLLRQLILLFCALVIIFIIFYYLDTGSLMYYSREALGLREGDSESVSNYQGYARSLAILFLYILAVNHDRPLFLVVSIFFASVTLFFAGARSELVGLILAVSTMMTFNFLTFKNANIAVKPKHFVAIFVLAATLVLAVVFLSQLQVDSRIMEIYDLASSSSYIARTELFNTGISHILANPLFGVFGGHIRDSGGGGGYIHNILSAWAGFGFPAFTLILYLQLTATLGSFVLLRRSQGDLCAFAFLINLFSTILIVTSKPVFWEVPPLGWGLFLQALLISVESDPNRFKNPTQRLFSS